MRRAPHVDGHPTVNFWTSAHSPCPYPSAIVLLPPFHAGRRAPFPAGRRAPVGCSSEHPLRPVPAVLNAFLVVNARPGRRGPQPVPLPSLSVRPPPFQAPPRPPACPPPSPPHPLPDHPCRSFPLPLSTAVCCGRGMHRRLSSPGRLPSARRTTAAVAKAAAAIAIAMSAPVVSVGRVSICRRPPWRIGQAVGSEKRGHKLNEQAQESFVGWYDGGGGAYPALRRGCETQAPFERPFPRFISRGVPYRRDLTSTNKESVLNPCAPVLGGANHAQQCLWSSGCTP